MQLMDTVLDEINQVISQVKEDEMTNSVNLLLSARRIFVLGEGRSGLQGKGFAMRLMHLGFLVYVIGESTTPSVQEGDVVVAMSGSGLTETTVSLVQKAKKSGVKILGVSSDPNSPLVEKSDVALIIPGATKTGSGIKSIQLLSTLFDQTLHITLDYVCLLLSKINEISNEQVHKQHSNME